VEFGDKLETIIEDDVFKHCSSLRCVTLPLKGDIDIASDVFEDCANLSTVKLVGGSTKLSPLCTWIVGGRDDMKDKIHRINQVLSTTSSVGKTVVIRGWMRSAYRMMEHYKAKHKKLLKEATTILELALWKVNLEETDGGIVEQEGVRTTRGRRNRARKERCITSGASIVIKNVLPFLSLE
jgi:hypothetical protein